ncbi:hypothetical protein PINS_up008300 [Pythium insidiosum]|nr:hypothetical protein PINS_up008300 [Pythium insidiosum]
MNWAEGPYQVTGYHPHQQADESADAAAFATQRSCERKFSEELEDANIVMIPRLVSLQPTRQLPYVPERMISPPGFLLPSLSSEGGFLTPHDNSVSTASGGNSMMGSPMESTSHPNPYAMQPVLDMQQFDESASVDLQQLFPPAPMHSMHHGGYSSMPSDPSPSSDAVFQQDGASLLIST